MFESSAELCVGFKCKVTMWKLLLYWLFQF